MAPQWHTETRKLKDLKPHPHNPRRLTKEQRGHIKASLEKFGVAEKPIINTDGTVIGGHQRLKVLKEMGVKEIEVWVPDQPLDAKQVDELNIRLNKNTGEWDFDILANAWDMGDLLNWGFSAEELTGCFGDIEKVAAAEDEDSAVMEPPKTCPHCGKEIT